MVESSFNPMAYSRAHASGLWQFIPAQASATIWRRTGGTTGAGISSAFNVGRARLPQGYLRDDGDWHSRSPPTIWGENAVARAVERTKRPPALDYSNLSMPLETRHYVPKLQALKNIIANPERSAFFSIRSRTSPISPPSPERATSMSGSPRSWRRCPSRSLLHSIPASIDPSFRPREPATGIACRQSRTYSTTICSGMVSRSSHGRLTTRNLAKSLPRSQRNSA